MLTVLDDGQGLVDLYDNDALTEIYDPNEFTFNLPDGRSFTFRNGRVTEMTDRNGNKATFLFTGSASDGVYFTPAPTASNPHPASTRKLKIVRNANGLVAQVFAPNELLGGNTVPTLTYHYARYGQQHFLTTVKRLTDKTSDAANPKYQTTSYVYYFQDPPPNVIPGPDNAQLITRIANQRGLVARSDYDDQGRLIATTDGEGNRTEIDHNDGLTSFLSPDAKGRETITDPLGYKTIHEYDTYGNIVLTRNALGKDSIHQYVYDGLDRKTSQADTDPLGHTTTTGFEYYPNSTVVIKATVITPHDPNLSDAAFTTTTLFNSFGQATDVTDANQHFTHYDYVAAGDPSNVNAVGKIKAITDAAGKVTSYSYRDLNSDGVPDIEATDALLNKTQTFLDPLGRASAVLVWPNSGTVDAPQYSGQAASRTDYTYDDNGNQITTTTSRALPNGTDTEKTVTTSVYDDANRLLKTTTQVQTLNNLGNGVVPYPELTTITTPGSQTAYDESGQVNSRTSVRKSADGVSTTDETRYEYYSDGKLARTTFPDLTYEEAIHDAAGHLRTNRSRGGKVTSYSYDALGRQDGVLYPDTTSTTSQFDDAGRLVVSIDARGYPTHFGYDAAGNRIAVTNALGQFTLYSYDGAGNLLGVTNSSGVTTYQYDTLNRRTMTIFPDGTFQTTVYDELGRRTAETDQAGVTTGFQYDGQGNLTAVTNAFGDPDQTITFYQYDERGNLTQITDAQSSDAQPRQTKIEYDTFGRKTKRILPGGKFETFQYYDDNVGNLWIHTDFNLKPTTFEYDSENRLLKKTPDSSFGAVAIQFTYAPDGQRETMTGASGTTKYEYLDGRLWKKNTPYGTLTYTRNESGNVTGVTSSNPNGLSLAYQWDPLNRLSTVTDNRAGGTTAYVYDQSGRLQEMDYPSSVGVKHVYAYDELDRLTGLTVSKGTTTLGSFAYTLGPAGNRTQVVETLNNSARAVAYGYDRLFRLTNETITGSAPTGTIGYDGQPGYSDSAGFDKVGNRWLRASTVPGVSPATCSYDNRDRLTSDTYDDNGNTTVSGGYTYTYDFENRLVTRSGSPAISMVYDGDGNRVSKTAGTTTYYLDDDQNPSGYSQVVEELSAVGPNVVSKVYTYGQRLVSQRFANGTVQCYGQDGHGNTRLLLSDQGTVVQTYSYEAFGILISPTSPPVGNDYLYCGEQLDRDLGLYYLRARYYNAQIGRFWTMDPAAGGIGGPPSLHRYSYTAHEPVGRKDPSGRAFIAFDGTANWEDETDKGRTVPTNVRIMFLASNDPNPHYVRGVGNAADDGSISEGWGLGGQMFGAGMNDRVNDAMAYLAGARADGDKVVDIVGFSRGGIEAIEFANEVADKYPDETIRFVGLYDPVGSVGLPNFYMGYRTTLPARVQRAVQALSIDESRRAFKATYVAGAESHWFRGVHSDIGGGFADHRLSDWVLTWMTRQAQDAGVPMDLHKPEVPAINPDRNAPINQNEGVTAGFTRGGIRAYANPTPLDFLGQ